MARLGKAALLKWDHEFESLFLQRRVRRTFGPSAMGDGESIAEGRPTGCSVGFSPGSLTAPIAARCREQRLHAAEAHQCHAAEPGARWRPGELALYEVQFGADRRKVLPPLIGRPEASDGPPRGSGLGEALRVAHVRIPGAD